MGLSGLLLAAVLGCPTPVSKDLIGLWESIETSKGGIGHTLEFTAEGSFIEAVTVLVNLFYRLEDRVLFVADSPAAVKEAREGVKIKIEGNVLMQTEPDDSVVRKDKIGKDTADSPIVGAWRYRHYTGAMAFERYTPTGRLLFRLPMSSSTGCYEIATGSVILIRPTNEKNSVGYKLQGDYLDLRGKANKATRYQRDTIGAWYPRANIDYQSPPQDK